MAFLERRRIDGGKGAAVELAWFLMMIGSAILSALAILRPKARPAKEQPKKVFS